MSLAQIEFVKKKKSVRWLLRVCHTGHLSNRDVKKKIDSRTLQPKDDDIFKIRAWLEKACGVSYD